MAKSSLSSDSKYVGMLYDPPSGWMYGFPKVYAPLDGESMKDTLLRDGYPQHEVDSGLWRRCLRFIGHENEED